LTKTSETWPRGSITLETRLGDLSANHSPAAVLALPALVDYRFSLNLSTID
jgi:hypothetical protein